jgi:hypothetical protein
MRTSVGAMFIVALSWASAEAQQANSPVSVDAIAAGLKQPHSIALPPAVTWIPPANPRLGPLTLTAPDVSRGQFVKVVVPVGEWTTRLGRSISSARYHRRERKARVEVERDLRAFLEQQKPVR